MPRIVEAQGDYRDGLIRLHQPLPELEGQTLTLRLTLPETPQETVMAEAAPVYPGLLIRAGKELAYLIQGKPPAMTPRIRDFRKRILDATGFTLPPVRLESGPNLPPEEYAIYLRGRELARGVVHPQKVLVMVPEASMSSQLKVFDAPVIAEPIFGLPAVWLREGSTFRAERMGLTPIKPAGIVTGHLQEVAVAHMPDLLTMESVSKRLAEASGEGRALIDETVPRELSEQELLTLLQGLLKLRKHIGKLSPILEGAREFGAGDIADMIVHVARKLPEFDRI